MEKCIPYGPLSWIPLPFSVHPMFSEQFQATEEMKAEGVYWLWCVSSFSTSYRSFSTLHEKSAQQAYNCGRHLHCSPGCAWLQAIHTCMAVLGSEPGHVSFWVKMGNSLTSVRYTWTCELVAKCCELLHGERCSRKLKQRRKNIFHSSSMELPATCSLLDRSNAELHWEVYRQQVAHWSRKRVGGWLTSPTCYLEKFIICQLKGCFVLPPTTILHIPLLSQLIK